MKSTDSNVSSTSDDDQKAYAFCSLQHLFHMKSIIERGVI